MNGWQTSICPGRRAPRCRSDGLNPDVDEASTALSGACRWTSPRTASFASSRSGTLSCIQSASATAAATESHQVSAPSAGRARSYRAGRLRRALSRTALTCRLASGLGSNTAASQPLSRNRAAQPLPITPPPMMAALIAGIVW